MECPYNGSRSNKQPQTALSSAAAETHAFSEAVKDSKHLAWRIEDTGQRIPRPIEMLEDNKATISFQKTTKTSTKLRGVYNLRWNWVTELRDTNEIKATKVDTDNNIADMLTKCQPRSKIEQFLRMLNIVTT